jgi:hypothetical protein
MNYIVEKMLELGNRCEVLTEHRQQTFARCQEIHLKWVQSCNLYGEDSDTAEEYLEWYEQLHHEWFTLDDKVEKLEKAIIALGEAQKALEAL